MLDRTNVSATGTTARPLGLLPEISARRALGAGVRWARLHWEWLWLGGILLTAGLVHGINMFNYPYIHDDEGSYTAQAWAVLTQGRLSHYTYFYDHSPLGWFQIAGWMWLSERLGWSDGAAIHAARTFMLVVQLASVFMLYRLARSLTGSVIAASLAALLFALSPYGVYWHRRVMLDNIMTLWLLVALYLAVDGRPTLQRTWLSGLAMGFSILSKLTTIALVPVLLLILCFRFQGSRRWLAMAGWTAITGSFVSLWVLMAALKNELFPSGTLLGGDAAHTSLIESLVWQASRDKDAGIRDLSSQFWVAAERWMRDEPLLLFGGTACALVLCLALPWRRVWSAIALATPALWLFLGRGGVVNDHFMLPLLPLFALNIAMVVHRVSVGIGWAVHRVFARVRHAGVPPAFAAAVVLVAAAALSYPRFLTNPLRFPEIQGIRAESNTFWRSRQTDAQWQALDWLQSRVSRESYLIIDDALWVEFRRPPNGLPGFPKAHYYYKLESDPEIRDGIFHGNWRNVDYLVSTPQIVNDAPKMPLVSEVLANSTPIARFITGGWPVEIRRVNKLNQWAAATHPMLLRAWEQFQTDFLRGGRVADPTRYGATTSEAQGTALLQAVYMNDRATFDQLWRWTKANLQIQGEGLFATRWDERQGAGVRTVGHSTAGADQDIALALLFASQRWGEPSYQSEATLIVKGIWENETVVLGGRRVLVAGDWARGDGSRGIVNPVVNLAYIAPYAYRIFAVVDPQRPWMALVDSSYDLLAEVRADPRTGGYGGTIANWIVLNKDRSVQGPATQLGPSADEFSTEAALVSWRLGLDWLWFKEGRAKEALQALSLPREELQRDGRLYSAYHLTGVPVADDAGGADEAVWMYAASLANVLITDESGLAYRGFAERIQRPYATDAGGGRQGDTGNLRNQTWAWFATALMDGSIANLWAGERVIDWESVLPGR